MKLSARKLAVYMPLLSMDGQSLWQISFETPMLNCPPGGIKRSIDGFDLKVK